MSDQTDPQDGGLGRRPGSLDDVYLQKPAKKESVVPRLASKFRAQALDDASTGDIGKQQATIN